MIEYTPTPDFYEDYICHYGVKGMRWRKGRKTPILTTSKGRVRKTRETERARLNRLNPASSRKTAGPVTTVAATTEKAKTASAISSSSSKSSKGKGSSKKAVKDILSRFKLTKTSGGKKAAEKKESTKKAAAEKKTTEKKAAAEKTTKAATEKETTKKVQEPVKVVEKINEDYTKRLEEELGKKNYSKLQNETVKERITLTDDQKKRKARNVRKIYTRS